MGLFILSETSAGYVLFKAGDKKLLKRDAADIAQETSTAEGICSLLKLKKFQKFDSAASAVEEAAAISEGKVTPMLTSMLESIKDEKKASLAVADPKLGTSIGKLKLDITPIADSSTNELYRAIRSHLPSLVPGLLPDAISTMNLGLSHSMSRHKLRFSPEKVDLMIIQAIALLDELDKELNTYAMRTKEWYGWHFPEMAKIINDNMAYCRVVLKMGYRTNASNTDLSDILPEEIEGAIKAAAEISMGTEVTQDDLDVMQGLATEFVEFAEFRQSLGNYLGTRMAAIAPNLTTMVGELVGARLIAHAGSLINLAKSPASTIQILGAEKALFRALKTKHDTPKYGLIYHASLVGQATGKNKGKIARMLATKTALALRVDSLSPWGVEGTGAVEPTDEEKVAMSVGNRLKVERRLRSLEGKALGPRTGVAIGPAGQAKPGKWELKEARKYNRDADGLSKDAPAAAASTKNDSADVEMTEAEPKLIEEIDESDDDEDEDDEDDVEAPTEAPAEAEEEDEEDEEEDEEDGESDDDKENSTVAAPAPAPPVTNGATNGKMTKAEKKAAEKETRYAEKLARRAARAAKREVKAARKTERLIEEAEKAKVSIAKHNEAILNGSAPPSKKRKHEDADEKVEKKSKPSSDDVKADRKKKKHKSSKA